MVLNLAVIGSLRPPSDPLIVLEFLKLLVFCPAILDRILVPGKQNEHRLPMQGAGAKLPATFALKSGGL